MNEEKLSNATRKNSKSLIMGGQPTKDNRKTKKGDTS